MTEEWLGAWFPSLEEEIKTDHCNQLRENLRREYNDHTCWPSPKNIFRAFKLTDPASIKVVIIGQDPYPRGHADGLAFSSGLPDIPFSLQRILREVDRDVIKTHTYTEFKSAFTSNGLDNWATQGVFLINPVLTVRDKVIGSHKDIGWQKLTTKAISVLTLDSRPKVFMIWGTDARATMSDVVTNYGSSNSHLFLECGHPASGAHGKDTFSGCNHFSKANRYLHLSNQQTINWRT